MMMGTAAKMKDAPLTPIVFREDLPDSERHVGRCMYYRMWSETGVYGVFEYKDVVCASLYCCVCGRKFISTSKSVNDST